MAKRVSSKAAGSRARSLQQKTEELFDVSAIAPAPTPSAEPSRGASFDPTWAQYEKEIEADRKSERVDSSTDPAKSGTNGSGSRKKAKPEQSSGGSSASTPGARKTGSSRKGKKADLSVVSAVAPDNEARRTFEPGDRVRGKTLSSYEVVGTFERLSASGMLMIRLDDGKQALVDPAKAAIEPDCPASEPDTAIDSSTCDTCEHQKRYQVAEGEAFDCNLGHIAGVMSGGVIAQSMPQSCQSYLLSDCPTDKSDSAEPTSVEPFPFIAGDRVRVDIPADLLPYAKGLAALNGQVVIVASKVRANGRLSVRELEGGVSRVIFPKYLKHEFNLGDRVVWKQFAMKGARKAEPELVGEVVGYVGREILIEWENGDRFSELPFNFELYQSSDSPTDKEPDSPTDTGADCPEQAFSNDSSPSSYEAAAPSLPDPEAEILSDANSSETEKDAADPAATTDATRIGTLPRLLNAEEVEAAIVPNNVEATIVNLLDLAGFAALDDENQAYFDAIPEHYRGWEIASESNLGAVDLKYEDRWFSSLLEDGDFSGDWQATAIAWAKQFIDLAIDAAERASGQLSLLEVEPDSPADSESDSPEQSGGAITETRFSFPDVEALGVEQLAELVETLHSEADEANATAIAAAKSETLLRRFEGEALIAMKKRLRAEQGHGAWEPWLSSFAERRGCGDRTLRIYMQIAANWEEGFAELPLREAIDSIRKARKLQRVEQLAFLPALEDEQPPEPIKEGSEAYHNGFAGKVVSIEGDQAVFCFYDGERRRVPLSAITTEPPTVDHSRSCLSCRFCEAVSENSWYCQQFKENYSPDENPAPKCDRFAPPPSPRPSAPASNGNGSNGSTYTGGNGTSGDRNGSSSAPPSAAATNNGNGSAATVAPAIEVTATARPRLVAPPDQKAAEAFIMQYGNGASLRDVAKRLLSWCEVEELEDIEVWVQQRLREVENDA